MSSKPDRENERVRRTRGAIVRAFNEMVLRRRYDDIQVGEIAGGAGVGRSTFYEHFRGKDALLEHALEPILAVFADAVTDAGDAERVRRVLEHFAENRKAARLRLQGASAAQFAGWIAERVEARLAEARGAWSLAPRFVAQQVGDAQVALVREWLRDPRACAAGELARALVASSRALVAAHGVEGD